MKIRFRTIRDKDTNAVTHLGVVVINGDRKHLFQIPHGGDMSAREIEYTFLNLAHDINKTMRENP